MKIVRNLLAVGIALTLLAPAIAQQTEPAKDGAAKPAVNTTQAAPAQPAPNQPETTPNPEAPRPDLNTPPAQYDDTSNVSEDEKSKGEEDVVPTYNKDADASGKDQDLSANTYDKKPNPAGDAQKLDATRYDEKNAATDGKEGQLEAKPVEGDK